VSEKGYQLARRRAKIWIMAYEVPLVVWTEQTLGKWLQPTTFQTPSNWCWKSRCETSAPAGPVTPAV